VVCAADTGWPSYTASPVVARGRLQFLFHPRHAKPQEVHGVDELTTRLPHDTCTPSSVFEIRRQDLGKVVRAARVVDDPVRVVEAFDDANLWTVGSLDQPVTSNSSLVGHRCPVPRDYRQAGRG